MMTNNTANPTGDESAKAAFVRVAMAKSAVQGLITGACAVIFIYSIGYLFSIPFSISQVIIMALVGATIGASAYLRYVWAWIICSAAGSAALFFFKYPGWLPGWLISALVFVLLLLTIAAVAWRPHPHPRQVANVFFRKTVNRTVPNT